MASSFDEAATFFLVEDALEADDFLEEVFSLAITNPAFLSANQKRQSEKRNFRACFDLNRFVPFSQLTVVQ